MMYIRALMERNIKLFFRDKGMFFTSLITPVILLVLYATFLGNVYRDSFMANLPAEMNVSSGLIDALVAGQLTSSILAVSCVTVAFCSNFLMVQDKALGIRRDFGVSPVRSSLLSAGYYLSSLVSTLIIAFAALAVCLAYQAAAGWHMSFADVLCLIADVLLLVLFGVALSSLINAFLSSQGQISAVGTVVSSGYGFICGAYMPVSSFSAGLQRVISFLPGTYGTALVRRHCMQGALSSLEKTGVPEEHIRAMMDALDMNLYFFDHAVSVPVMYLVLAGAAAILLIAYIAVNAVRKRA